MTQKIPKDIRQIISSYLECTKCHKYFNGNIYFVKIPCKNKINRPRWRRNRPRNRHESKKYYKKDLYIIVKTHIV